MDGMDTSVHNLAVDMTLTNIGWFGIVGLLIVAVLIAAFVLGGRVRAHEPPPPPHPTASHTSRPVGQSTRCASSARTAGRRAFLRAG